MICQVCMREYASITASHLATHDVSVADYREAFGKLRSDSQRASLTLIRTTHGRSRIKGYNSWRHMLGRCRNEAHPDYSNYGGRGIEVCERWLSFENFIADLGPRPSKGYSIDRRDNSKGYSLENCRWATAHEQQLNTSQVKLFDVDGELLTQSALAHRLGLRTVTLRRKLRRGELSFTPVAVPH